jgi:DNA-binding LacI/PurR family transcriptional regulator
VDDVAGAYAATKYLTGLGHERVLFHVHETVKPHCSIQDRLNGYLSAMAGPGSRAGLFARGEEEVIDVLVRGDDRPTAVIATATWKRR